MEFKKIKLKELCTIKHGYAFKGQYITIDETENVLVTPGNFKIGGGFKESKCKYYKNEGEILEDYVLNANDLIVTMTDLSKNGDTLGYSALVPNNDEKKYLHNQRIGLIKNIDTTKIRKEYIYWFMRTKKYQKQIVATSSGTTVKHTSPDRILDIEIPLCTLKEQEKIIKVLENIDKKIELNNNINDNLYEVTINLYLKNIKNNDSIDFEEKTLDELCNIFTGKKNANANKEEGKYKFFTCAPEPLLIDTYIYDGPAIIISGNGAYTGRTTFYNGKFDLYQRTYAVTEKDKNNYIYLLYAIVKSDLQNNIMGGTHGSAIPYIVMNDIAKFKVKFNQEIFDEISCKIKPFLLKIKENERENECLAQLRDTLLPRLMNGEIDLDKIVVQSGE